MRLLIKNVREGHVLSKDKPIWVRLGSVAGFCVYDSEHSRRIYKLLTFLGQLKVPRGVSLRLTLWK
jgi:hypothetical protein